MYILKPFRPPHGLTTSKWCARTRTAYCMCKCKHKEVRRRFERVGERGDLEEIRTTLVSRELYKEDVCVYDTLRPEVEEEEE